MSAEHIADKQILDYGCGDGGFDEIDPSNRKKFLSWLQAYGGTGSVGIDIDPSALSAAKAAIQNGTMFITTDGTKIPFQDETFDHTHMNGVLHHAQNPMQVLKELHRVTKQGGSIILTESVDNYLPLRVARRITGKWKGMEIRQYFNCKTLVAMVNKYYTISELKYCWHPTIMEIPRMYNKEPEFLLPLWEHVSVWLRKHGLAEQCCVHCVIKGVKRDVKYKGGEA